MTAETRTTLYMTMAWMGAAAMALYSAAAILDWPDFVKGLSIGMLLVSLLMLLRRRLRDEYVQRLWVAGTSLSFAVLVLWFLLLPFARGLFDGLPGDASGVDLPDVAAPLALLAFFVGFLATWAKDRL